MKGGLFLLGVIGVSQACPTPISKRLSNAFNKLKKRQTLQSFDDVAILNYALTLEHLEDKFYRDGLANFTAAQFAAAGYDATFYSNLQEVSKDETTHVDFLTTALQAAGATPVQECTYAFGVSDVAGFIGLANVLEGVGTSAYLGAAAQIKNKDYLTAAGSVLTVEARHSAYIRASLSQVPFPSPQEVPLTPNQVFSLASPFIASCPPENPALPVRAFPGLTLDTSGTVSPGQTVALSTKDYVLAPENAGAELYAAFVTAGGPVWAPLVVPDNGSSPFQVTIPAGVLGQSYLLLVNCNDSIADDKTIAGPTVIEISGTVEAT